MRIFPMIQGIFRRLLGTLLILTLAGLWILLSATPVWGG